MIGDRQPYTCRHQKQLRRYVRNANYANLKTDILSYHYKSPWLFNLYTDAVKKKVSEKVLFAEKTAFVHRSEGKMQ